MQGISSKSAGKLENKKKFNGIEHTTDLDLNQYDAFFRTLDPQVGRWWQIDPRPTDMQSLYAAMDNNPIKNMDFLGDTTYIYTMKGVYKGTIYDNQKNNEVVMLTNKQLRTLNTLRNSGDYSEDVLGQAVRLPSVAQARITGNTIESLTSNWNGYHGKEAVGFLYVDPKTKEVKVSVCKDCGTSATEADPQKLAPMYNEVAKKGTIIGMWHSHPKGTTFQGSQPSETGPEDFSNPSIAIKQFGGGAVGMIVSKNTATIYPLSNPVTPFSENRRDNLVTTPTYSKDFRGSTATSQYGVFNNTITPKTYWTQ